MLKKNNMQKRGFVVITTEELFRINGGEDSAKNYTEQLNLPSFPAQENGFKYTPWTTVTYTKDNISISASANVDITASFQGGNWECSAKRESGSLIKATVVTPLCSIGATVKNVTLGIKIKL